MDKEAISQLLDDTYFSLFNWLEQQDPSHWEKGPQGKWSTGQHVLHLLETAKIINTAMSLPKFILRYKYGKSNREVRDYNKVVSRYQERLNSIEPGITFGPTKPKHIPSLKDKSYLMNRLTTECKKMEYKTKKWSDEALDKYVVPHPLMGKMPVREMVMWSAYHVEHHAKILKENY